MLVALGPDKILEWSIFDGDRTACQLSEPFEQYSGTSINLLWGYAGYLQWHYRQPVGFKLLDVLPKIELFNLVANRGLVTAHCCLSLLLFHTI